jgi:hypothetical protein
MGGDGMAGHAPELLTPSRRFVHWLSNLSDLRISVYMLLLATLVATILYVINVAAFS